MFLPDKQECVRRHSLPNAMLWFLPVNAAVGRQDVRSSHKHPVAMWSLASAALSTMVATSYMRSWVLAMWLLLLVETPYQISKLIHTHTQSKISHEQLFLLITCWNDSSLDILNILKSVTFFFNFYETTRGFKWHVVLMMLPLSTDDLENVKEPDPEPWHSWTTEPILATPSDLLWYNKAMLGKHSF